VSGHSYFSSIVEFNISYQVWGWYNAAAGADRVTNGVELICEGSIIESSDGLITIGAVTFCEFEVIQNNATALAMISMLHSERQNQAGCTPCERASPSMLRDDAVKAVVAAIKVRIVVLRKGALTLWE
jgi:hypothetical protein